MFSRIFSIELLFCEEAITIFTLLITQCIFQISLFGPQYKSYSEEKAACAAAGVDMNDVQFTYLDQSDMDTSTVGLDDAFPRSWLVLSPDELAAQHFPLPFPSMLSLFSFSFFSKFSMLPLQYLILFILGLLENILLHVINREGLP